MYHEQALVHHHLIKLGFTADMPAKPGVMPAPTADLALGASVIPNSNPRCQDAHKRVMTSVASLQLQCD